MKVFVFIIFLFSGIFLSAQPISIPVVPDSIINHSDAVIINEEITVNLLTSSSQSIKSHQLILVNNPNAANFGNMFLRYDKFETINRVLLNYYDLKGNLIKRVRKKDFNDYSASGHSSLYVDDRILVYEYVPKTYPYIVEKIYQKTSSNTAFIPGWYPVPEFNTGVLKSSYAFTYPSNIHIFELANNLDKFHINKQHTGNTYKYSVSGVSPVPAEPFHLSVEKIFPSVRFSADKFQLAGVKGTANSWKDFGKWMQNQLLAGRNTLPETTIQKVKNMVKGINDPVEKAKIIYDYVQKKTRYINVSIGIGGWQPMTAAEVDKLGYGDCKALTYYTKTLLDIAGVPSLYTIVYAGEQKRNINKNLVGIQGNHVFLCLPQKNDSIWLECTSQKLAFGAKNAFTDDRQVLAITPQGGELIHTYKITPEENLQFTKADCRFDNNNELTAKVKIDAYGKEYDDFLGMFDGLSIDKTKDRFRSIFKHLHKINFNELKTFNNKEKYRYEIEMQLNVPQYFSVNKDGSILFIPNIFNRLTYVPPVVIDRKTGFALTNGYQDKEEYSINFPENFEINDLPAPVDIKQKFGHYTLKIEKKENNTLLYKRTFVLYEGEFSKDDYLKYRKFRKKIKKLELQKILIIKH